MNPVLASIDLAYWQSTAIKLVVVALLVPTTALILGIVFLFKVMSWMQSRKGPQEAGPLRLCIHDITLNRNTMPRIRAVVGTRSATTTSLIAVDCQ